MKLFYVILGCIGLGLGAVGAAVPLLPAFPFLMLAAFCFARSSRRLNDWFLSTRLYKNNLESFVRGRGMTRAAKLRIMGVVTLTMAFGFAMMGRVPAGRVWLDRLLIDAARQGRGYGRAAVASLLARLAEEYGPRDIYLSVVDGNTAAARLYEAFGFVFTEERDVHGEHVMRRPAAPVRGS